MADTGAISLAHVLATRSLSLSARLDIAVQIATGVEAVHRAHLVHRDINPSNIIVTGEGGAYEVALIDFGLTSPISRESATLKNPGTLAGTLPYLAPEQSGRMNRDVDARSDLWHSGRG